MLGSRFQRGARLTAVALVSLSALAACGKGGDEAVKKQTEGHARKERVDSPGAPATTVPAPAGKSFVATAALPEVAVYPAPDAPTPLETFENPYATDTPLVFLVDGADVSGAWLPVYAPMRPNGTKGFVKATDVTVQPNPYSVKIELGAHHIVVTKDDQVVVDNQVGLGADGMQTPTGMYFIRNLIKSTDPAYGPYAYGLSAFSDNPDVIANFPGGQVGLHGTSDPSSIGSNVSHGCIRVNNDVITQLAQILPLGTPVEIVV